MSLPITKTDEISQRINKLLPADITAAFVAIYGAVPGANLQDEWIVYGAIIIAIIAPFYFYLVLGTRNILHIIFLLITYLVFVVTLAPVEIGNVFFDLRPFLDGASVIITPIWVFIVTPIVANILGGRLGG